MPVDATDTNTEDWLKTLISGTPDELAACLFGTWSAGERVN